MAKFECFFCLYPDIDNLQPNNRTRALALELSETSPVRIVMADNKADAIDAFIREYAADSDGVYLRYPQCRSIE